MSSDAVAKIAEESKKITDSVQSSPSMFGRFFETITSSISTGIFVSPPFSLDIQTEEYARHVFNIFGVFLDCYYGILYYRCESI